MKLRNFAGTLLTLALAGALALPSPAASVVVAAAQEQATGAQEQAAGAAAQNTTVTPPQETDLDRRVREISSRLRCPVCQSQSILESNSGLALEMRNLVRESLLAGDSQEEIEQYFVGRYGEWVLLDPEARGFNLTVYVLPVLLVLVGSVVLVMAARRWMRQGGQAAALPAGIDETDPDLAPWEESTRR